MPRKNATGTRGRPFKAGNPGRPKGARNKASLAVEALLDGEAEGLARKAVELALAGDTTALRLCLERIAPPRKDAPVRFALPEVENTADAANTMSAVLAAVAAGGMTPNEGQAVAGVVETWRRMMETADLEARIAALEANR